MRDRSRATLLLLWAALLAFAWQAIVTQAHRHVDATTVLGQSLPVYSNSPSEQQSPVDSPANCAICREAAHAGPLLLPVALGVSPPPVAPFVETAEAAAPQRALERSHRWQSRAPPLNRAA